MIQDVISTYNVPIFNIINKYYEFTILYRNGTVPNDVEFNTVKQNDNIYDVVKENDILICSPNFKNMNFLKLIKKFGRKKTLYYGIGVSASYNHSYDDNKIVGLFFSIFLRWIGGAIFYSEYPKRKYIELGVNRKKMFVANNTTYVKKATLSDDRTYLLFIGSLYKEKGIDVLLNTYSEVCKMDNRVPKLLIVGEGNEKPNIEMFIDKNNISSKIEMLGAIYDEELLKNIFSHAIVCISPKQAGLSVLKSMGYGVPFITHKNAITGGEIFNINENNGIIYKDQSELKNIILDITDNKKKYFKLGINAQKYYYEHCTIEHMSKGFIDAIKYIESNI